MLSLSSGYMTVFWLALLIILLVIEILTVGLTSIWGVGGAFVAMLLSIRKMPVGTQIIAFLVVTVVLLIFTRPFAMRFINTKKEKTNYESIIGKRVCIAQRVDNLQQTGMAVVNGQEWTVRSEKDSEVIEPGTMVKVVSIAGVKLIVKVEKEDEICSM